MVGIPSENDTIYLDKGKEIMNHALNLLSDKYYHYTIGKIDRILCLRGRTFTIYLTDIRRSNVNEYISFVKSFKINDSTSSQR